MTIVTTIEVRFDWYLHRYETQLTARWVAGILLALLVTVAYRKRDRKGEDHDDVHLVATETTDIDFESSFVVLVYDNFHYMDDDESYEDSRYTTMAQAERRCIEIIDK